MAQSVRQPDADLVTAEVLVNGNLIADKYLITAICTEHAVNSVAKTALTIEDGDPAEEDFVASSSDDFDPGAEIEVRLGYHAKNKTVFKGIITGQRLRVTETGVASLQVDCRDKAAKLTVTRNSAQYFDMTDSDITRQILDEAGLKSDVSSTNTTLPYQGRNNLTDWDFILDRAEVNGHVVLVRNGKVTVAPPKFETPDYSALFGDSIMEVDLSLDATAQLEEVEARAWDATTQTVVTANSSEPTVNRQGNLTGKTLAKVLSTGTASLVSCGAQTPDMLKDRASARLLRSRMSRFQGRIKTPGNAGLEIGTQIALSGLGRKFNGDAYVTGVRHDVEGGIWASTLQIGLSPDWFADRTRNASAAFAPGTSGLEIATVLKTHEDPQGEQRIMVSLPLRGDGDHGIWVRITSPYATRNAGIDFLPEVGDEVVLGFLAGDPDAAIVLGSLHSSARPAPTKPDEENTIKTIVTRARHKVSFDDDKKIITVETPGGHKIEMSDDDQSITISDSNENRLEMAKNGITLTSPKDIAVRADGSVTIAASGGAYMSSPADIGIRAANVAVDADISLTAKGNAKAELSSAGETSMRGTFLVIN